MCAQDAALARLRELNVLRKRRQSLKPPKQNEDLVPHVVVCETTHETVAAHHVIVGPPVRRRVVSEVRGPVRNRFSRRRHRSRRQISDGGRRMADRSRPVCPLLT